MDVQMYIKDEDQEIICLNNDISLIEIDNDDDQDDEIFISPFVKGQSIIHKILPIHIMQIIFYYTLTLGEFNSNEETVLKIWDSKNNDRYSLEAVCVTWCSIIKASCRSLILSLNNLEANTFRITHYTYLKKLEIINNINNDSDYSDFDDSDDDDSDGDDNRKDYSNDDIYYDYFDQKKNMTYRRRKRVLNDNSDKIGKCLATIINLSLPNLSTLNLSMTNLKERHVKVIQSSLSCNRNIRKLAFDSCPIGDQGVVYLSDVLESNQCIRQLDLQSCGSVNGLEYLGRALSNNQTLEKLIWSYNQSNYTSVMCLSNGLRNPHSQMKSLIMKGCDIEGWGALSLADTLAINKSLKELDLGSNQFGDAGAITLASKLNSHPSLSILDLSSNLISTEGFDKILFSLESNTTLTNLNLSRNQLDLSIPLNYLTSSLAFNKTLTSLNLSECNLQNSHFIQISIALQSNKKLKKLNLSKNNISDIKPFFTIIQSNKTLKSIYLSKHKFKSNDLFILLNYIFKLNDTVTLENGNIIDIDIPSIIHQLEYIDLSLPHEPLTKNINLLLREFRKVNTITKIKI
ncbi:leucine-rich repeat-containing protein [Dictyostelium discoideum AX4]|uniref:Leucine-rich repeat-containing protein n=1 Tax=Dictyostelium discoideum TaxID=44689 RepID=C7FZZ3_DICDI|nr:leucine-rich repeat-containing protein [Dictyostelium discoideum AX4]EEU04126.1 leucine-rich repeat-containing protein [Dictyostelium discoideum AX4]|eukprot:XP_002649178.1 leucine-rich repeat-containing protein [Dictyostelium discoideum AX4]